jgi:sarcosine oxidase subunit beta
MREQVDVCIIGGGVVGLFCAIEAIAAGKTVRVVDKTFIGATRNNIGELMRQGHHPDFLPLVVYAQKRWQQAADSLGVHLGLEARGSVYLARATAELEALRQQVEADHAAGANTRLIDDRADLLSLLKVGDIGPDVLGGRLSEHDMAIDTGVAMDALRRVAISQGVRLWGDDEVTEIIVDGHTVKGVRTRAGDECVAAETIIAAGVWSVRLLRQLDLHLPMRPARCHLVEVSPSRDVPHQLIAYATRSGDMIAKYLATGRVLMGYTGLHDQAQATWFTRVDKPAVNTMLGTFGMLLPCYQHAAVRRMSTVSLSVTPDHKPYLGRPLNYNGLLLAIGFNGKSYAVAAGVARVLADLMANAAPQVDITPFSAERFRAELPTPAPRDTLTTPATSDDVPLVMPHAVVADTPPAARAPHGTVNAGTGQPVSADMDIGQFISK